jgi:WS/DGAT/MGAT family acyltransferase
MARYERLGTLDRFFVDVEQDHTHMHVAAVMLFDAEPLRGPSGGVDIRRIREYIGSRLHLIPRYRQKLSYIPFERHPVWVDDDRLNLSYHVRHTSLPAPGEIRQLKRLAARIMSQKLDRGKPLWETWVVEGIQGDLCALITKTHHCMIDGVSGVDLMGVLLGQTPESEFPDSPAWNPEPQPSSVEMIRDEVFRRATTPFTLARGAVRALSNPAELCSSVSEMAGGIRNTLDTGMRRASDTPLNRSIGPHRRFDWQTFDLRDVKTCKNALGGTVNDVVLATVAGATGKFLELRGIGQRQQQHMDFRVFCPVSVRDASERGQLGNRVSGMIVPLPIAERDPAMRLAAIRETTAELKEQNQAMGAEALTAVSEWTVPTLLTMAARLATRSRVYNMIVTNVPGPQVPLYLLGARLLEAFPLVPLFGNQALGVALFSYTGKICWGFNADWDLLPDLHDFVEAMDSSFQEMLDVSHPGADMGNQNGSRPPERKHVDIPLGTT